MRRRSSNRSAFAVIVLAAFVIGTTAFAQSPEMHLPQTVEAGTTLSISTQGTGEATLYVVGPAGVVKRDIWLGESTAFGPDEIHNAGHYAVFLIAKGETQSEQFDLVSSSNASKLSFLAKPSRLPVNVQDGVSGVVYVFDVFGNLVTQPQQVSFELSEATHQSQARTVETHNGVAWLKLNSAAKAGTPTFAASVGSVHEKRIIQQVAGDPCSLKMTAKRDGKNVVLETDPVRDCVGNPVPDGTIVTFTEVYGEREATVDVPLKRGVARTELPGEENAVISVASGVVMGNEIRWGRGGQ